MKRPRDGDRRAAFLSSLPAPKNAASKTSLIPDAGAAAAPATAKATNAVAAASQEVEFEVDADAYSDVSEHNSGDGGDGSDTSAGAVAPPDADDDAPALGPTYPPPDYYAHAYPEVPDEEQEQTLDYSNRMFDQSVPVEGAVTWPPHPPLPPLPVCAAADAPPSPPGASAGAARAAPRCQIP